MSEAIPGARYVTSSSELWYVGRLPILTLGWWNSGLQRPAWLNELPMNLPRPATPAKVPRSMAIEGVHKIFMSGPCMGTDPEFFVAAPNGKRIPAFKVLNDKHTTKSGLFWDGFQAETKVVASPDHMQLACNFNNQLQKLRDLGLQPSFGSCWRIPDEWLATADENHVALGCDPSYNLYGMTGRKVMEPRKLLWRFAGGHLHFELTPEELSGDAVSHMVWALDSILGIPCVALAAGYDNPIRRQYYGLAGEFRLPPHGLEYRSLSNFWLQHPIIFNLVTDLARHALNLGRARLERVVKMPRKQVVQAINFSDVRLARELVRANAEFYTAWAFYMYGTAVPFWKAIEHGLDAIIKGFGKDPLSSWSEVRNPWKLPKWPTLK